MLSANGQASRSQFSDGLLGNYPADMDAPEPQRYLVMENGQSEITSEDKVKRSLKAWLEASGWEVSVIWGRAHGIDLEAKRNGQRWIIEAKGCGSRNPMRVNYFLGILGELLQRMDDPDVRYSLALPDTHQFRRLVPPLPQLAKARTTISALFVSPSGKVEEVLFPS